MESDHAEKNEENGFLFVLWQPIWDHLLSTYAKYSEKLTFIRARMCAYQFQTIYDHSWSESDGKKAHMTDIWHFKS